MAQSEKSHPIHVRDLRSSLEQFIRGLATQHFGHLPSCKPFDFELKGTVDPEKGWSIVFEPSLQHQILEWVQGAEAVADVYQQGSVYCYLCRSMSCDHAQPPSPTSVFAEFNEVGAPQWKDFTQYLIDCEDERIDQIYLTKPPTLCRFDYGRDLKTRLLKSFGKASRTYALLGQIVAGRFVLPSPQGDPTPHALTIQAVQVHLGGPLLTLNVIGSEYAFDELMDQLSRNGYGWVQGSIKQARHELDHIDALGRKKDQLKKIPNILRRLVRQLEQGDRKSKRRTAHATQRVKIERPIQNAMSDLAAARPERTYVDSRTTAIVVYGQHGRCHVFSPVGRHMTTFVLTGQQVAHRLKKNRWKPIEPDAYRTFRRQASG